MEAADQALTVDGKSVTSATAASFANPGWAQLSGSRGQVGYTFPGAEPLRAAKTMNTGSWFDINAKTGRPIRRSDTYFSLWVESRRGSEQRDVLVRGAAQRDASRARRRTRGAPETTVLPTPWPSRP